MKPYIYTILIALIIPMCGIHGQTKANPVEAGTHSGPFDFTHGLDTRFCTDEYGLPTKDAFYRFTITTEMDIVVSHCNSLLENTYIYLLNSSFTKIESNNGYTGPYGCPYGRTNSYIRMPGLSPGTYYVVSEGYSEDGDIYTNIQGISTRTIIEVGTKYMPFEFSHTQDTRNTGNSYNGEVTNDIFYKFTLQEPMTITVSHCGSEITQTFVYLLNENHYEIAYKYISMCDDELKIAELATGTYYVVSEGTRNNGNITTTIRGSLFYDGLKLSDNQNYILKLTPTIKASDPKFLSLNECMQNIQYFDGLGRVVQEVQRGITPSKNDLILKQEYDAYGRKSKTWLPVFYLGNDGIYKQDLSPGLAYTYPNESKPYSEIVYEQSPLNRVVQMYGPGDAWHSAGKSVTTTYLSNTEAYNCKLYTSSDNRKEISISSASGTTEYYTANQLYVTKTTDEDGINETYEFQDKLGQIVLTRQMNNGPPHNTYYIHDSFGNLRVVLPPLASDNLSGTGTWTETNSILQDYAYLYKYDDYNRCIAKKLPGAEWIYYVYDKADNLIFTQDGEMRAKGEWLFSIPDIFERIVLTGVCNNSMNYAENPLANIIVNAVWAGSDNAYKGYNVNGITLTTPKVLTADYYDNYNFLSLSGFSTLNYATPPSGYGIRYPENPTGFLTGTVVAEVAGGSSVLYSATYYDDRGRIIQSQRTNQAAGKDCEYISYNFVGQPLQRQLVQTATGRDTQTQVYTYTYDHAGRLTETKHKLNALPEYSIAKNTYDDLGRLNSTIHHNQQALTETFTYNIRSWLSTIRGSQFNEDLGYNFNGDIAWMQWQLNNLERKYTFNYDGISQLLSASYTGQPNETYSTTYSYDKHGNIKTLNRYGKITAGTAATSYGEIDRLTMSYSGNRLTNVEESIGTISLAESNDFKKYSTANPGYVYNLNGALTKDLNKGISAISYNSLNLPYVMDILSPVGEGRNTYSYAADGRKLKVVQQWNSNYSTSPVIGSDINVGSLNNTRTIEYLGNIVYETLNTGVPVRKQVLIDGGYVDENNIYHYYFRDHLGNNRVITDQNGTVKQQNHYYPFGMTFAETPNAEQGVQPYKYNDKELDRFNGLNWYDYMARHMDSAAGRFTTMDPMAEKYFSWSPYVYCGNNPMKFVDLDGRDWYSYMDDAGNIKYEWSDEIYSQSDLDNNNISGTYLGITYIIDDTYYSLFGQIVNLETKDGRVIQKMDDAIIKYAQFLKDYKKDFETKQQRTNFDIGSYLRKSSLGLYEDNIMQLEYGTSSGTGIAYYYNIAKGQPNIGTFESWGKNVSRSNSNRGSGNMIDGYNVLFPRDGGTNANISIRLVFPTLDAKNNLIKSYEKLLLYRK